MSKETAVEFLIQQIELALKLNKVQINFEYRIKTINPVYEIARKMEREQMIDAYSNGWHDGQDVILQQCKHIDKGGDDAGQQYYNETYKGGEQ